MGFMSAKNKIYVGVAVWVVACASMFMYFFHILDNSNQLLVSNIGDKRHILSVIKAERDSYQKAKKDLQELQSKPIQPDSFFSKDVTLVNEIRTIEQLGKDLDVAVTLTGVSGTAQSAAKAKTSSSLAAIPCNLTVVGDFSHTVAFVESLENLDFITNVSTVNVSGAANSKVNITLGANFYIKK